MSCSPNIQIVYGIYLDDDESTTSDFTRFIKRHTGVEGDTWLEERDLDAHMAGDWNHGTYGCVIGVQMASMNKIEALDLDKLRNGFCFIDESVKIELQDLAEKFAPALWKWGIWALPRYI